MENSIQKLSNLEFLQRVLSAIIFVPLIILPILFSNYLLITIYLIINSIIIWELNYMKINAKYKILINVYVLITIISFFLFLLILITTPEINILFIQLIFTIWFFDTFSYLGGKLFGKKKLMPAISSGKTINGLIIGFVFSLFFSQILKYYLFTYSITFIFETILIVFRFY